MLRNNPVLHSLKKEFKSQFSLEDKYYELACDIQDIVISKQRGENVDELENKVRNTRNDLKYMSKK
jgi:hypothetical protein